jgi:hypothetical protein
MAVRSALRPCRTLPPGTFSTKLYGVILQKRCISTELQGLTSHKTYLSSKLQGAIFQMVYLFTKLHGATSQNRYISTKRHGVITPEVVPVYRTKRNHKAWFFRPSNYEVPHFTKLHGVIKQKKFSIKLHVIHQKIFLSTERRHIRGNLSLYQTNVSAW